MTRYYDQPTTQCCDCRFWQDGSFPNGTPYKACRRYGYLLHYDKPVTDEKCDGFSSQAEYDRQAEMQRTARSMRDLARLNRKH